jgi:two-component system, cell cycle response regulator CpdR
MGQSSPLKPIALVVEDDVLQRELVGVLLEESEMEVIQCESAEGALCELETMGRRVSMMFTDVNLVIVTSGNALTKSLPDGVTFIPKPLLPLDILREAVRS